MNTPNVQCIGFILDGNRRWAKERGLPKLEGHRRGFEKLKDVVRAMRERNIPHVAAFMFSTENWGREKEEVSYLMDLFREMAKNDLRELGKEGVRIRFVGQLARLDADLQQLVSEVEEETKNNTRITLWACISYGGRAEIVEAVRKLADDGAEASEENLRARMWAAEMPDPDIIIRTGGEQRLSGFLLWESAYSELFFVDPYWPDFSEEMLDSILSEYASRERRMGK